MEDRHDQCVSRSDMLLSVTGTKIAEHSDPTIGGPHKSLSRNFNIPEQPTNVPGSLHRAFDISVSNSYGAGSNLVRSR